MRFLCSVCGGLLAGFGLHRLELANELVHLGVFAVNTVHELVQVGQDLFRVVWTLQLKLCGLQPLCCLVHDYVAHWGLHIRVLEALSPFRLAFRARVSHPSHLSTACPCRAWAAGRGHPERSRRHMHMQVPRGS